ncbi:Neural proliferation differentiation and control protein 1 [Halotydeus destructor]|nr:Neural proliferation differentiation and control protein 1 [Halotydeus destructor]
MRTLVLAVTLAYQLVTTVSQNQFFRQPDLFKTFRSSGQPKFQDNRDRYQYGVIRHSMGMAGEPMAETPFLAGVVQDRAFNSPDYEARPKAFWAGGIRHSPPGTGSNDNYETDYKPETVRPKFKQTAARVETVATTRPTVKPMVTTEVNDYLNKESVDPPRHTLIKSDQLVAQASPSWNTVDQRRQNAGDIWFVAIVVGSCLAAMLGVFGAGYCVYKFNQQNRAAADCDYPAYGVVGPMTMKDPATAGRSSASPSSDRKLAQNAQMYHYQHQKQHLTEKTIGVSRHTSASDAESEEEENEDGDYTVYECPGLAPTGEMEVNNPLFVDDATNQRD